MLFFTTYEILCRQQTYLDMVCYCISWSSFLVSHRIFLHFRLLKSFFSCRLELLLFHKLHYRFQLSRCPIHSPWLKHLKNKLIVVLIFFVILDIFKFLVNFQKLKCKDLPSFVGSTTGVGCGDGPGGSLSNSIVDQQSLGILY